MKHEIEIQDLPEGWEPVAYRKPLYGEYIWDGCNMHAADHDFKNCAFLVTRKKQPRRIVLEETCEEDRKAFLFAGKHWKIVEDNKCAE